MIKIYTSQTCPNCAMLKRMLKNKNIDFIEKDYTELPETNIMTLPIIDVDSNIMDLKSFIAILRNKGKYNEYNFILSKRI